MELKGTPLTPGHGEILRGASGTACSQDVSIENASRRPRPLHAGQVELHLHGGFSSTGGGMDSPRGSGLAGSSRRCLGRHDFSGGPGSLDQTSLRAGIFPGRRPPGGFRWLASRNPFPRFAQGIDHSHRLADGYALALFNADFRQNAVLQGLHLQGGLVGLDLRHHLSLGHRLSDALEPTHHHTFFHGVTEFRHGDLSHECSCRSALTQ